MHRSTDRSPYPARSQPPKSLLVERQFRPSGTSQNAITAAGGLWVPKSPAIKVREVIAEAKDRGVRALTLYETTNALPAELPDLEFLVLPYGGDVALVNRLSKLRLLSAETLDGRPDFSRQPDLEWLFVTEADSKTLSSLETGHPGIRELGVGRYAYADLRPLANLSLRRLSISLGRRFASLDGASALASSLTGLALGSFPALSGLDGIELLADLQALSLRSLRAITTLDAVAALGKLRFLDAFDLANLESLRPLTGHPSIEFLWFGRTKDLDLDPLTSLEQLRIIHTGGYPWNRPLADFPLINGFADDHPDKIAMRQLQF